VKGLSIALLAAALLSSGTGTARAQETPALFDLSLGVFDMQDDGSAAEGRVEWRGTPMLWWLRPMLGVSVTSDAAVYGYAGLAFELWWANRRIVLTPSAAVGAYHKGDGKDLGHVLEFRTGAALQYRFDDESRLGISFHHVSNAGLGKNKKNPGEESLMLSYAIPVSRIFK
jgi:lipid A 3-O-deacylase